jgi:hypothetical protein
VKSKDYLWDSYNIAVGGDQGDIASTRPFSDSVSRTITAGAETAIPSLLVPLPIGTVVASNTYVICWSKEAWGDDPGI